MQEPQINSSQNDPGDFGVWPVRKRKVVLPSVLFVLTCLSTFWVGVAKWNPVAALSPLDTMALREMVVANWQMGVTYMVAVLLILFLHEMGHFVATLIYKVPASYPFFLPFPLNPIGTLGAVIGMQGYIADRKQIFDIGIAGPIAGLVAAVPIAWFGVSQLDLTGQPYGGLGFRLPLVMQWFAQMSDVPGYSPENVVWLNQLNPLFVAGWVGMLITGLNMMPVGQLDGGHVTFTLFGKTAHLIARLTLVFAIAFMVYYQSVVLIVMVILLLFMGTDHPPTRNDSVKLGAFRWVLGLVSLAIPVLCFPPLIFKMA
jgi:membrane-associated protease RseP (regulator of RpoE activity)